MRHAKIALLLTAASVLALGVRLPAPRDPGGPEVYRLALSATVLIATPGKSKGTGWVLDRERRLIVTNFHVVGDQDAVEVIFPAYEDGRVITSRAHYTENRRALEEAGRRVRGRVLHREPDCDLALLELPSLPDDARALPLAAAGPRPGEVVHSVGNRGDTDALWTHTAGTVRQVVRTKEGYFWHGRHLTRNATTIVTQSPINDGDSGGPLVNARGELVGVLAAVQWQTPLAGVAIDVSELRAFLTRAKQDAPRREPFPPTRTAASAGSVVYARLLRSTAWVRSGTSGSRSTGWLLDRDRKLLVASQHVVGSQEAIDVIFPVFQGESAVAEYRFYRDNERLLRQRGHLVRGRVLARDARRDLALLELDSVPDGAAEVELAERSPNPGERIHTIGNPNGIEALWVYAAGTVRQLSHAALQSPEERPDPAVVLAQLPGSSQDSGGPVVNDDGRLVGVVTGKEAPQQLVSYCLDVSEVKAFVCEARPLWDPRSAADHRQRAALHLRTGQYARAVAASTIALSLDPASAVLLSERAHAHRLNGDLDRARADCDAALRLDPRLPAAYVSRAAVFNDQNDPDRALADCAAALKLDPKCAAALAQRAAAHRLKGDLDRAVADADEALWLDPRLASACCVRGLALTAKGQREAALADLNRAVELDPYSALTHRARGDVYRLKNEPDKAIADYTQAIELAPKDALAHVGRGLALALKDRHEPAVADFTRALEIDPRLAPAFAGRGTSRMRQGDLDRAMSDYAQALRLAPPLAGDVLRDVRQRAAELGAGERYDVMKCCELCRQTLRMVRSFEERADVRKAIDEALAAAEREADVRERAQILRAALAGLRERIAVRSGDG